MAEKEDGEIRFEKLEKNVEALMQMMTHLLPLVKGKGKEKEFEGGSTYDHDHEEEEEETLKHSFEESKGTSSHQPFKVEAKLDIPTYDGEVNAEKLDHWLDQLETYFTIYAYSNAQKLSFARLKLCKHALTWWNAYLKTHDVSSFSWRDFKKIIKKQFYPIGHEEDQWVTWQYLRQGRGVSVQDYTSLFFRHGMLLGINMDEHVTLMKFIGGLHEYIRKELRLFKVQSIGEASRMAMAIESKSKKSTFMSKDSTFTSNKYEKNPKLHSSKRQEGKKKRTNFVKSSNYCEHCDISGHITAKCWKLHPELKPKHIKDMELRKKEKGKALLSEVEIQSEGEEEKVTLLTNYEDDATREELFHLKLQVGNSMIGAIIDPGSQKNLISESLVKSIGLVTTPHPHPYPLGWIHKDVEMQISKQCTLKFSITNDFVDEVICDVVPLDVCHVVLGSPYLWDRDALFYRRERKYRLVKDNKGFIIKATKKHLDKIALISATQAKRMINACGKFVILMVRRKEEPRDEEGPSTHTLLISPKQMQQIEELKTRYDILFQHVDGLPPKRKIEHEITLVGDAPLPNVALYRHSIVENNEIKRQVEELLDQGVIRPSCSPCGSPIVLVPKKDGGWRMCIDFRALNKITIKNRYPLPRIDDLLDQIQHACYFTKLDLKSGYHQVRVKEEDTWKTAFKTKQGLFEWMVMPFGLCNAPATFMRLMNEMLRPYLDNFVVVYLDDILIFSNTWEEHLQHIEEVLKTMAKHHLKLNVKKCEFGKENLIFLGFVVGGGKLSIDPLKTQAILKWPRPTNITEVRSFLGACQYLRKFILHFSQVAAPLHGLTKSSRKFTWGSKEEEAFLLLKKKICEAPVLAMPNLQRPFEVEADASGNAMGAVLIQDGKPIAYHSEVFTPQVKNYPTYDREMFALHQACKHWRSYLLGKEVVVHTDHKPLQFLQTQSKLQQARHMKWMSYLQQFNIVIKYKKGSNNKIADMLSRPPCSTSSSTFVCSSLMSLQVEPMHHEEYKDLYHEDEALKEELENLAKGRPSQLAWKDGLLFKGEQLYVPSKGDKIKWLREAHTSKVAGHFGIEKTLANLRRYVVWPKMQNDVKKYVKGCVMCNTSKPSSRKLGLYTPLPIPTRPWESISIDFLGGLPMTRKGHDYLFVVVDRFSKMICLIPCKKTITGTGAAELFFEHVWKNFGLPSSIISDRDTRFLSSFWKSLWEMMDTKLKRSTSFHPQTDGQTEVVNRTLVHLLRGYNSKHPKTWDESLAFLQFAFNRAMHASHSKAPFEVCLGYLPQSPFDLEFSMQAKEGSVKEKEEHDKALRYLEKIQRVHKEVHDQLLRTQQKYKERHDKHRQECTFQEGDLVWLYLSKERLKGEGKKLKPIRYGPFKILRKVGCNAFQLDLPPYMQIYSVVNAEYLKLFEPSMLDEEHDQFTLPSVDDLYLESEEPLKEDCILERKSTKTRQKTHESFRIGVAGQLPSKAKWFSRQQGEQHFPHLQF